MPNLLYIDTSGSIATLALSQSGRLAALRRHEDAQEQAACINLLIDQVVEEAGISLPQIDAICICAGPGSYTGLRVGLSTAKGLCYALDKPLFMFDKLYLIALDFQQATPLDNIAVLLKARQGEYFYAQFDRMMVPLHPPMHLLEAAWLNIAATPPALVLSDNERLAHYSFVKIIPTTYPLNIDHWIPRAEQRFAAGQWDDLAYAEPFYLKPAYTTTSKK
jgi:tRNA threonylcarbamoyladenosine biosynthesis protein TsaB